MAPTIVEERTSIQPRLQTKFAVTDRDL